MVILEIPALYLLCQPRCCWLFPSQKAIKLLWILDLLEILVTAAILLILYFQWNYLAQITVFLVLNLIATTMRLISRPCKVTQAYNVRTISLVLTVLFLGAQTGLTYWFTSTAEIYDDL